ncbi:hypothetical protein ABD76_00830 [Paenibacillus dendritiformis]|nr:hypothetical protein [Paenibacillus dendritiformis]
MSTFPGALIIKRNDRGKFKRLFKSSSFDHEAERKGYSTSNLAFTLGERMLPMYVSCGNILSAHAGFAYTALFLTSFAKQNSLRKHRLQVLATFSVLKPDDLNAD